MQNYILKDNSTSPYCLPNIIYTTQMGRFQSLNFVVEVNIHWQVSLNAYTWQ